MPPALGANAPSQMAHSERGQLSVIGHPGIHVLATLLAQRGLGRGARVLVVGCGSGIEAAVLGSQLGADVWGIDIQDEFDASASKHASLAVGDAMQLSFGDESFDLVFSYHALEHISDPAIALSEMARVLKPSGNYLIGVPNKLRAVGYIGGGSSLWQKIRWNSADWRDRLLGRFDNASGAHAGFSSPELRALLLLSFQSADELTDHYYLALYSRRARIISTLVKTGLSRFAFPSVYFYGTKRQAAPEAL
jgi:SAM-dependent methyltransferase